MQLYQNDTPAQVFSCKFSEIFKKTYFVEQIQTDAWVKWTKKNCVHKIYSEKERWWHPF